MTKIQHPTELIWIEGELPDVHEVSRNCCALVWMVHDIPKEDFETIRRYNPGVKPEEVNGTFKCISTVSPWSNELNPLRWDGSPSFGNWDKVKFYAWIVPPYNPVAQ